MPTSNVIHRQFIKLSNEKVGHDVTGRIGVKSSEYVGTIFSGVTEDDASSRVSQPPAYVINFT